MAPSKKTKQPPEPLTPEILSVLSGLALTDEQAEEVVSSLNQLGRILVTNMLREKQLGELPPTV